MKISNEYLIVTVLCDSVLSLLIGGCCVQTLVQNPASGAQVWQEFTDGRNKTIPFPKEAPATSQKGASLLAAPIWTSLIKASNYGQERRLGDSALPSSRQDDSSSVTYTGTSVPEGVHAGIWQPPRQYTNRPQSNGQEPSRQYTRRAPALSEKKNTQSNSVYEENRRKRQKEKSWFWWEIQKD